MNQQEIFDFLKTVLVDEFEVNESLITMDARLYEELDLDSIDAVDLVIKLQEFSGKKIKPEEFKQVRTIADVVDTVAGLLKESQLSG